MEGKKILADNRKARFNYMVLDSLECGIALQGTEVKSMRAGKFSFTDAYARIRNGELWLVGFHITPYEFGNIFNHEPVRERRLLAHKDEIKRLQRKVDEKGLTLVPLKFYLKGGIVKLELGVCQGKKLHDKRQSIKERDDKRAADREFKQRL
ncbi:SsrA-binding protein [Marispirochaeta aestuarii]|uniref:SsrA-binding protein n=1 Tax=Marispirochaeta aestuarii TaxID=1963862 RepID=A0A1Y1S166_9SPIO|nr:SsrA-binding protein SmpB [Marispirochaeta aestuarii]ORC37239.1 SsrA-binding protein [Marispirochaeta aestuarii]